MSVVFKKDGKYLRCSEATTHTGAHRTCKWVEDLQEATVFYSLPPYRIRQDELQGAERLEVRRGAASSRQSALSAGLAGTGEDMNAQERTERIATLLAELSDLQRQEAEASLNDHARLLEQCKKLRQAGARIDAVKLYRNKTSCGLRIAMDVVDAL